MSKLTRQLIEEHKEISAILKKLRNLGLSTSESKVLLVKSKANFLAHLSKEDKKLYPPLYEKAKTDESLKRTLNIFADEMKGITDFVLQFYENYTKREDLMKSDNFIKDISKFISALQTRILKEEVALYKLYDKLGIEED